MLPEKTMSHPFSIQDDEEHKIIEGALEREKNQQLWVGGGSRFSVTEAMLHRGIFLVVAALFIVFCVCLARNGELGGSSQQWLDEVRTFQTLRLCQVLT